MSTQTSENNKRIAKNTLYLDLRMLVFLFLGLFTARVTINALGVHDYGLMNMVGGVMGFLGYFSSLLSQETSNFIVEKLMRLPKKMKLSSSFLMTL